MNLKYFFLFQSFIFTIVAATIPQVVDNTEVANEDDFDLQLNDLLSVFDEALSEEQLDLIDEFHYQLQKTLYVQDSDVSKRDLESSIESILKLVNNSGVIWDALDYGTDHPRIIQYLANTTANLVNGVANGNTSSVLSFVTGAVSGVNASAIGNLVLKSGLIEQVLDGVLLEEKYRKDVSQIIYQIAESNMDLITVLLRKVLQPANKNSKRANSGSLTEFVGNLVGGFLKSDTLTSGLESVLNALNDTRFITYTVQRFIDNEEYVNMTGSLLKQVIDNSDISLSDLPFNLTSIVESALSDTSRITDIVGKLLKGDLSGISSFLKRYNSAFKAIIKDLEDKGLFVQLNNNVFPSSTTTSSSSTSTNKKILETGLAKAENATETITASDNGSTSSRGLWSGLMVAQAIFTVLFFV